MDLDKLQQLIRIVEESGLAELEIEEEGTRIRLRKPGPADLPVNTIAMPASPAAQPAAAQEENPAFPGADAPGDGLLSIDAPMVGVFYVAPAPGEPPFVKPGDTVAENQTVCIVEAMKLMNEVTAQFPAEVVKVLVENGEPVEFGQPLFAVRRLDASE